jgi:hypothetical protein
VSQRLVCTVARAQGYRIDSCHECNRKSNAFVAKTRVGQSQVTYILNTSLKHNQEYIFSRPSGICSITCCLSSRINTTDKTFLRHTAWIYNISKTKCRQVESVELLHAAFNSVICWTMCCFWNTNNKAFLRRTGELYKIVFAIRFHMKSNIV